MFFSDTVYHASMKARHDIPVEVCNPVTVVASSAGVVESLWVVDGVDAGSFKVVVVVENSSILVPEVVVRMFCSVAVTKALPCTFTSETSTS